MHVVATYQRTNKVALVAGTRLVNFQASAATLLSADLLRPLTELPSKLGRESAIYINKISMVIILSSFCLITFLSTNWATQLALDFYFQLCLYIYMSLYISMSLYLYGSLSLCISVSLSLSSISHKPNLTLNMPDCWPAQLHLSLSQPLTLHPDKKFPVVEAHLLYRLGAGTMGRPATPPPPSARPHLNLRGLVFNFKFKVSVALSFFLLRIFFLGKSLL